MRKEIKRFNTKEYRMRSQQIYEQIEKDKLSEATKEAFFRKPYGLEKGKKKNE